MEFTRRNIVAGAAALTASAAAGVAAIAHAEEAEQAEVEAVEAAPEWDDEADIVIAGAGMGGMCAGLQALENGIENVLICEISRWLGGSTSFAFGTVHVGSAGTDREHYDQFTRGLGNDLGWKCVADLGPLHMWLAYGYGLPMRITAAGVVSAAESISHGHDASAPRAHMINENGEEGPTAPHYFFDCAAKVYEDLGGRLMTETAVKKVLTDDRNNIVGVLARTKDGRMLKIKTTQVVLATGGFQNNSELKQKYFNGDDAFMDTCMSSPYLTGSGMIMAQELGASLAGDMAGRIGEWMCAYPAKNWMEDVEAWEECGYNNEVGGKWWLFSTIIDNLTNHAILVNLNGKRFCDELGPGHGWERYIDAQPMATAHLICDQVVWDEFCATGTRDATADIAEKLELVTSDVVGGKYYVGATLEELADNMNAAGIETHSVHKANFLKTVAEYNEAAKNGTSADLEVPRTYQEAVALENGPFYALPLRNATFLCQGGVAVDDQARVLDHNHQPIPGLYATIPCAGGFQTKYYTGSIASAGITGRWAANAAAVALGLTTREDLDARLQAQYEEEHAIYTAEAEAAAAAEESVADDVLVGTADGIGGILTVNVKVDADGKITEVTVPSHSETQGIGSVAAETMPAEFVGLSTADEIQAVDGVAGASVTSQAIRDAVQMALGL